MGKEKEVMIVMAVLLVVTSAIYFYALSNDLTRVHEISTEFIGAFGAGLATLIAVRFL